MNISSTENVLSRKDPIITKPEFSLVFYSSNDSNTYVTKHDFEGEVMLEGSIVDLDDILEAIKPQANQSEKVLKLIPENLLFESDKLMVWHSAPCKLPMWFRGDGKPRRYDVNWPSLLFVVNKKSKTLYLYTLDTDQRPSYDSMTYWSPLANVYEKHNLCQGSAPLPAKLNSDAISDIEKTVYMSAFSGFKHSKIFKKTITVSNLQKDGETFWMEKEKEDGKVNPAEELYAYKTVREVIEGFLNNQVSQL